MLTLTLIDHKLDTVRNRQVARVVDNEISRVQLKRCLSVDCPQVSLSRDYFLTSKNVYRISHDDV